MKKNRNDYDNDEAFNIDDDIDLEDMLDLSGVFESGDSTGKGTDLDSELASLPEEHFTPKQRTSSGRGRRQEPRNMDETIYLDPEDDEVEEYYSPGIERRFQKKNNDRDDYYRQDARQPEKKAKRKIDKGKKHKAKNPMVLKIQILTSLIFIASVLLLNVLPIMYLMIVFFIVGILGALVYSKLRPKHRHRRRAGWRFLSIVLSCLFLIGSFYMVKSWMVLGDITKGNQNVDMNLTKDSYTLYISGIDVFGEITQESRSDVNMLMVMNPATHKMLTVNTPRDYYVEIPGVSDGAYDKLTHAGIYGIDTSMATLSTLYNSPVEFSVRLNFSSMIDIVDALGGVTVDSDIAFTTGEDAGEIVEIQEGKNHLTGSQALAFSRERDAFEDGDNQRGINQQVVISAILKKAVSPMIIISGNKILNTIGANVEVNMSRKQLQQMIKGYLGGAGRWDNESLQATGSGSNEYCYSYSGGPLYVTIPDTSVNDISSRMQAVRGSK